jgi:hypothetical protein
VLGRSATTIAGVLVLTVAACAPQPAAEGWATPEVGREVPAFTAQSALPFDAFHHDETTLEAMQAAEVDLLRACAQRFGVDAVYSGDYLRPADLSRSMWGGMPGTLDEAHAAEHGYHASPTSAWAPVGGFYLKDPSNILPAPDASGDLTALVTYGPPEGGDTTGASVPTDGDGRPVPAGGCLREVEARIGGTLVSDIEIRSELVNLTFEHDEVVAAVRAWSDCMLTAGYDYDTVQAPAESVSLALLSAAEVDVALADVRCTGETRWDDVFYAVLADYQQQAVDQHPGDFRAVLDSQTARLEALGIPAG